MFIYWKSNSNTLFMTSNKWTLKMEHNLTHCYFLGLKILIFHWGKPNLIKDLKSNFYYIHSKVAWNRHYLLTFTVKKVADCVLSIALSWRYEYSVCNLKFEISASRSSTYQWLRSLKIESVVVPFCIIVLLSTFMQLV